MSTKSLVLGRHCGCEGGQKCERQEQTWGKHFILTQKLLWKWLQGHQLPHVRRNQISQVAGHFLHCFPQNLPKLWTLKQKYQQIVGSNLFSLEVVGDRTTTFTETLGSVLSVSLKFAPGVHTSVPPHTHNFCPTKVPLLTLWWHPLCPPKWTAGGKLILSLNLYTLSRYLTFFQVLWVWDLQLYSTS